MKSSQTCLMPGCEEVVDEGRRLCLTHAAAGNDLRVPKYAIDLGLKKIYRAIELWSGLFSVEDIVSQVDDLYLTSDEQYKTNCTNSMAKLFRTLRANNYITKRGHFNGFVCYSKNVWNASVEVSIDEEAVESGAAKAPCAHCEALAVQLAELQQKVNVVDSYAKTLDCIVKDISTLWDRLKKMDEHNERIVRDIGELKGRQTEACPVAKMRSEMHVMLGGKKQE